MNRRILTVLLASLVLSSPTWADSTPRKAPAFAVSMLDGSKISTTQYQGKVVILAMIMTTCPHCQAATRILSTLQREFGPKGLQVIEAVFDPNPKEMIPKFLQSLNPPFPVGSTNTLAAAAFMQLDASKRYYVPYVTFIDRAGMIRGQYKGDDAFNAESEQAKNYRNLVVKLTGGKTAKK